VGGKYVYQGLTRTEMSQKIASFYTNEDDTLKFNVGYIINFTCDHFVIAAISPRGTNDGYVLKELDSLFRISTGSLYEKKVAILSEYYNTTHECINLSGGNLLMGLLQFARAKDYIVSIELLNSGVNDVQGFVQDVTDEICKIIEITDFGEEDGIGIVALSDITKVSCNSSDEIILKILNSNGKQKD
jgi:hypothetical protein